MARTRLALIVAVALGGCRTSAVVPPADTALPPVERDEGPSDAGIDESQVPVGPAVASNPTCESGPEDIDGFEDLDGCADPDNDADGVLDEHDLCPNEPEDLDGFEDEDGCHDDPPVVLPDPAPGTQPGT